MVRRTGEVGTPKQYQPPTTLGGHYRELLAGIKSASDGYPVGPLTKLSCACDALEQFLKSRHPKVNGPDFCSDINLSDTHPVDPEDATRTQLGL
jgi:hypothetical protein